MKFIALLLGTVLSFSTAISPSLSNTHEDNRLGYSIYTPKKWSSIPISSEEGWVVAKFLSSKPNFYTDKSLGWTYEYKPEMVVIAFLSDKFQEDEVVAEADGEGGVQKITFRLTNPYKNYPDYLKGTYQGAGFYIAEEKEVVVGDYEVTQYTIKVEKNSRGPKRLVTWVYHTEDIDFAIQVECFETAYPKLKKDIKKAMNSFKEIPRTEGTISKSGFTGGTVTIGSKDLTPKERTKDRKAKEVAAKEASLKTLTEGWTSKEMGPFLVLNHTNDKAAKKLVEQGVAIYAWCEKNFPYIGEKEYVSGLILRICKDYDEAVAFSPYSWSSRRPHEIVAYKDNVGVGSFQYANLNEAFLSHWMRQKDLDLYFDMPTWMRFGLEYVVRYGKAKGKNLELRPSDWENMGLREEVKAGSARTPREIFLADSDAYREDNFRYEAAALMRFLVVGQGSKNRLTKNVLEDYCASLQEVIAIMEEEDGGSSSQEAATTEEEEEARFKARQARAKDNQRRVIEDTFELTFGSWTEKDWLTFEKLYFKAIK